MVLIGDDAKSDNELVDRGTDLDSQYSKEKMVSSSLAALATTLNPVLLPVGVATRQFANTGDFDGLDDGTVIDSIQQVCEQIDAGDWASAVVGGAGLAIDAIGAVLDPIGFVAGQLTGWMLEHVEPLRLALHQLTGNPDMVESYATTWRSIANRLAEKAGEQTTTITQGAPDWTGRAATAYRMNAAHTALRTIGASLNARALASATDKMKDVVDTVRGGVRDILADLVGTLLSCAAEALTGVGAPDSVRRALQAIAKAMFKAEDLLLKLEVVIAKLGAVLVDLLQLQQELDR
ncbi:hypothetical protein ABZ816_33525 [Actinosynnema sp. NPDC047251]|uniref:Uncharacterized protein n=1 Tax=Saccharothrix espanaensis (strain ATCC 51144 / DSM 44229 / JCM 9112 / NBRC 15066 / NRRL 15764) TaxID=1179773 RepID=K0K401_SACES|nr:hypothetical protein [Saccharothrix espanaensis]CCH33036.1 hypothetical protein BN6_57780 [Saccharothrix espanaensis DSM 44229]